MEVALSFSPKASSVRVLCTMGSSLLMWGMLAVVAVCTNLEALGLSICIYSALLLCQTSAISSHVREDETILGIAATSHTSTHAADGCLSSLPLCSVCLDTLDGNALDAPLYDLEPCGHQLHLTCVIQLLRHNQQRCPLCRAQFEF
jgi:hypothetical protein